jgi:hypothetical protein
VKRKTAEAYLDVIPFYYSIKDTEQILGDFALEFFTEFVKNDCIRRTRRDDS